MSGSRRAAIPIVVAGAVLLLAGWLDGSVVRDIQAQAGAAFDPSGIVLAMSLGSLAVAGSVLLLGALAWRSRSALVGAAYALVGAFFAFQPVIVWRFAAQINDTPPVLPEPIAQAISQIYFWSDGPLDAVGTIGAGMMVAGIAVLGRAFRDRSVDREAEPLTATDVQPIRS